VLRAVCDIGPKGADKLVGALENNRTLHSLGLGGEWQVSPQSRSAAHAAFATHAAHAAQRSPPQRSHASAGACNAGHKPPGVEECTVNVSMLPLSAANKIGASGATKFASLIERSGSLLSLELASNGIGSSGAEALTFALQKNVRLQYLGIGNGAGISSKHREAVGKLLERNGDPSKARKATMASSSADAELEELKEMLAKGPPSARHHTPAKTTVDRFNNGMSPAKTPDVTKSDDYMSAHVKTLRAVTTSGDKKKYAHGDFKYAGDNFMMSHIKKVKDATPTKSRPGAGKATADTYLYKHLNDVRAATGPQTFRGTKLVGSNGMTMQGVKGDSFLMQHLQQVEKEKKADGNMSSIGMTPHVTGSTVQLDFLKKVAENRKKAENHKNSSIGKAPKMEGDYYLAAHAKKLAAEEKKERSTSIGQVSHIPVNNYLDMHLKEVTKLTHTALSAKEARDTAPPKHATLPADSFLETFHKKSRDRHTSEPVPREREVRSEAANSFLLAHLNTVKAENARPLQSTIGQKPQIDTDDFTMKIMRNAQTELSQY